MKEKIGFAIDSLSFALSDFNKALGEASPVEGLILLQLTESVAKARYDAQLFLTALSTTS